MDFSEYIGIPFKSQGRDRRGIDCWGLLRLVYKERLGINLPSYTDEYKHAFDKESVSKTVEAHEREWVRVQDEKPFDVVLLRIKGLPIHLGIIIEKGIMIHAINRKIATCKERYDSLMWRNRILGFYRYGK